jgi:prophage antirepressor-like protein
MNKIELFTGNEFDVQIVMVENEPWFVARHVLNTLEIKDTNTALEPLDESEKLTQKIPVAGQKRDVILISEPGLYKILMRSTKPKAKPFQDWLAHEVIPSIRKTGQYNAFNVPKTYSQALRLAADLNDKNEQLQAENRELSDVIFEQAPKVEAFNELMDAKGCFNFGQAANVLGFGRNTFIDILRAKGEIRPKPSTEPYANKMKTGNYLVKITTPQGYLLPITLITPKGLDHIRQILNVKVCI